MNKVSVTNPSGALLLDKPAGISSAGVIRRLKHRFKFSKIGHAGTLDPMATGLLVVLLGNATKLQSLFLESDKTYTGSIRIGLRTDTDDICGVVLEKDCELSFLVKNSTDYWCEEIKRQFSGIQLQRPPDVSAVKVNGERSYKRVRAGRSVELKEREVRIEFASLEFDNALEGDLSSISHIDLRYEIACSKGTYVRSLARDIGAFLGSCASLASIRRIQSGRFLVSDAVGLEALCEGGEAALARHLISVSQLVDSLPRLTFSRSVCERICRGNQELLAGAAVEQIGSGEGYLGLAGLYDSSERFYALLESHSANGSKSSNEWRIRSVFSQTDGQASTPNSLAK